MSAKGQPAYERQRRSPVERALFQLLFAMTKGAEFPHSVSVLIQVFEDLQLMAYSLKHHLDVPYAPQWLASILHPADWTRDSWGVFVPVFWLCFAATMLTTGLMAYVAVQFQRGSFKYVWPLALLRYLSTLLTSLLFEPMVTIFLIALQCIDSPDGTGKVFSQFRTVSCNGANLSVLALGVLGLALLIPLGLLITYVFVECSPSSKNPHAKANGYCDLVYLVVKALLVVIEHNSTADKPLVAQFFLLPMLVYFYCRYMPYLSEDFMRLRVGIFLGAFLSAIISYITYQIGVHDSPAPLVMIILSVPIGLALGRGLLMFSKNIIIRRIMRNLKIKMEHDSQDAESGKLDRPKRRGSLMRSMTIDENNGVGTTPRHKGSITLENSSGKLTALHAVGHFQTIAARKLVEPAPVFHSALEPEIACRFLRGAVCDSSALEIMHAVFREAISQFPTSAVNLSYTYYLATYDQGNPAAAMHLEAAKTLSPPFDVRFRIFAEEREHEQETRADDLSTSAFDVASYVEYKSLEHHAITSHLRSLMCLKVFWQGLLSDQVNSNTVAAYLDTMHTTQGSASSAYKKLIERFPSSKQILRLYAKYLLTVENNAELSAQLLSQAEDIEFREQRDVRQRLEGPNGILPAANSAGYPSPPAVNYPEIAGSMMSDKGTTGRFHPSLSKVIGSTAHESVGFAGAASGRSMEISDDEESGRGYQNARVTHFPEEEIEPPTAKIAKVSIKPEVSSAGLSLASYNDEAGGGPEAEAVPRHKVGGARSTTSSATSNKDIRKMRAEKMRMMENLSTQIRRYILYERLWLLVLLGLIIANYDRSLQMFQAPDTFLSTLREETRARRICLSQSILVRQMWSAGKAASNKTFQTARTSLAAQVDRHTQVVLPVLFTQANSYPTIVTVVRNTEASWGSAREVLGLNPYELARLTKTSLERILQYDYTRFVDTATIDQDIEIRFWFDNTLDMCDAFHMFTGDMYKDYKARSSQQTMIIVGLLVVVVVVLVVAAVLFWMSLHHTKVEGRKWLKVLKGIPRSHLRHLTMDLEEEIEELFELEGLEDRAQTAATRHMETRLSHWLLQRYASGYVVSIFGLAALAVCLFAPPLLSSSQMDETATLILASNPRRFYGQSINYLSQELAASDANTWTPWKAQIEVEKRIQTLRTLHEICIKGDENTPSIYVFPQLDPYLRTGGICLRSTGCDNRPYNASYGFTRDLVMSGATYLIDVLLMGARKYLDTKDFTATNPELRLVMAIEPDIADGLETVDGLLLSIARDAAAKYQAIGHVLFALTSIYYVCFCGYFLLLVMRNIQEQIKMMVHVIFWVPPEIVSDAPRLQNFIAAGGMVHVPVEKLKETPEKKA